MANTTLLNAVTVNTTGSGTSITGPCVVTISDLSLDEYVTILHAATDTSAHYRTVVRRGGPDPSPVRIDNDGTYYLKAILSGVNGTRASAITVLAQQ